MVQLKTVSLRLKSIKNIQKITKTMKMVSASKFTRAERELAAARPFGYGPRKFYESSKLVLGSVDAPAGPKDAKQDKEAPAPPLEPAAAAPIDPEAAKLKRIYIAMTSDRGQGKCPKMLVSLRRRAQRRRAAHPARDGGAQGRRAHAQDRRRRRQIAQHALATIRAQHALQRQRNRTDGARIFGRVEDGSSDLGLPLRVRHRRDLLQQVLLACQVRAHRDPRIQSLPNRERAQHVRVRRRGQRPAGDVRGVDDGGSALLRAEAGRSLGAIGAHGRHGQRHQERRRHDPQADAAIQPHQAGRHHARAYRDHLGRLRARVAHNSLANTI